MTVTIIRLCKICNEHKDISQYYKMGKRRGIQKYNRRCIDCHKKIVTCEHNVYKYDCKDCKGSSICEHDKHRKVCKICRDPIDVTIRRMINSSKQEDIKRNRYTPDNYIDRDFLSDLIKNNLNCFWCNCVLQYMYYKNDLATIERLDNSIGHIKSNCTLACLSCNTRKLSNKK